MKANALPGFALSSVVLATAAVFLASPLAAAAQNTQTLQATPSTVAWGYYSAHAKPAITVHTGDTVVMQTASTCGPPERLQAEGVKPADIPSWLGTLYTGVPQTERGPGGHILTGPVAVAEAQPGDVLEVRVVKVAIDVPWACNGFGAGRGFLPDDFPYGRTKIIPLDRTRMTADFAPGITIPLHPFFGSMGIAPPESAGKWNSAPPWMHGGNMDNKELTAGSVIFYPVH
ncbi:MAG: acetamidase/formamidase family protein, partial [Janthinobacterium lividum]